MKNTTTVEENYFDEKRTRLILSPRAKNLVLSNKNIKEKIADAIDVDYWTVHRWIQNDDSKITQLKAMQVLRDQLGLTDELILIEVPVSK